MFVGMIEPLDQRSKDLASRIHAVFQRSYQQEARLVGATQFPPLLRTREQIQASTASFLGAWVDSDLAAVIEYTYDLKHLSINSLVVEPRYFRRGLASELLEELFGMLKWQTAVVETASANQPAIALYQRFGFTETERWETDSGIEKVRLKNAKAPSSDA